MDVSEENPRKWMVYNYGKPYEQMDDLGGFVPLFLETPIYSFLVGGFNPSEKY